MKSILLIIVFVVLNLSMYCQVIAGFDSDTTAGCCPVIIHFADNSSGNITSWQWVFGNGNTSTLQNPDASYVTPGVYTVS